VKQKYFPIVLYLDDGFGMSDSFGECQKDSAFAKQSLVDAGFLINEEKSIFVRNQKLEWLGILSSAISWRSVLLMEETGGPGENRRGKDQLCV
jgi:hypothetical protein